MAIGQFFLGTPGRVEQLQRFTPEQQQSLSQLLGFGMQGLQNPYQGFQPIADQATRQFQQQIVPGLAERFTSLGDGSTRLTSPAFASQVGSAGADLASNLAALQSQYGFQQRGQALDMLRSGLTPQFENIPLQGQQGALSGILPVLSKLLPFAALAIPGIGPALSGAVGGASGLAELLGNVYGGGK